MTFLFDHLHPGVCFSASATALSLLATLTKVFLEGQLGEYYKPNIELIILAVKFNVPVLPQRFFFCVLSMRGWSD
jgi:hypothetical protein